MDELPKLRDFLTKVGWDYGEGFVLAKTGNRQPAPWLTGKPLLPTNAFDDNGIDASKISTVTARRFRSAYSENRYSAPLVLIKEVETLPCVFWNRGFLAYRKSDRRYTRSEKRRDAPPPISCGFRRESANPSCDLRSARDTRSLK